METAAIAYRVIDFLKNHPPFNSMDEGDLLALTADGRVRFYEPHEYLLWQGEPHKRHVFVIQQGTVSLWDDEGTRPTLRDVRGAGDLLGIERFNGARACLHSARSESDVLIYAFAEEAFAALLEIYPQALEYVSAYDVATTFMAAGHGGEPQHVYLQDLVRTKRLETCAPDDRIRDVARQLLDSGASAAVVLDRTHRALDVLTADRLLAWIAAGGGDASQAVSTLPRPLAATVSTDAVVTDGVLAMATAGVDAVAVTTGGTSGGEVHAVVTARDLASLFGDQPAWILGEVGRARGTSELRAANQRARAFVRRWLTEATAVEWLARFAALVDAGIVRRLIGFAGVDESAACWCFSGAAGRAESLTLVAPRVVAIVGDDKAHPAVRAAYERLIAGLTECGYLAPNATMSDGDVNVASLGEWQRRFHDWIDDPVMTQMYRARPFFDLRPVHGPSAVLDEIGMTLRGARGAFLRVLAHDCLASLPPLTFFQDMVVNDEGEQSALFRLERSALGPLVDVGRVFGMAAGAALGQSTLHRFALARTLVPDHESIFREAADAFRVVLSQQGRVGISQGSGGFELPPSALSRYDRHLLKSRFRSIHRLIEFTADLSWLERL